MKTFILLAITALFFNACKPEDPPVVPVSHQVKYYMYCDCELTYEAAGQTYNASGDETFEFTADEGSRLYIKMVQTLGGEMHADVVIDSIPTYSLNTEGDSLVLTLDEIL